METNNINKIFGGLSNKETTRSVDDFTHEWEELQIDLKELDNIEIQSSDFPNQVELESIRNKINTTDPNSPISGAGIMLTILAIFSISVSYLFINHLPDLGAPDKVQLSLINYNGSTTNLSYQRQPIPQVHKVQKIQFVESVPINISQPLALNIEEQKLELFDFIEAQKVEYLEVIHIEAKQAIEKYVYDYNYKYMNNYKIYNYENRMAPPETLAIRSLSPRYSNWNHYRGARKPVFSNRVYETRLEKAFKYMKKERYHEVNLILESILEIYPVDQNALFYLGISNYREGNYKKSKSFFDLIIEGQPAVFKPESEWYHSLCLLHNGETKMAKKQLKSIASKNGFYQKRAEELLANQEN